MFLHKTLACLLIVIGIVVVTRSSAEQPFRGGPAQLEFLRNVEHEQNMRANLGNFAIVEARWGASDGWADVTEQIREQIRAGRLIIPDLNAILADVKDPKFGHEKALVVVYHHRGETRVAIVATTAPMGRGGTLKLPKKDPPPRISHRAFHKKLVGSRWRIAKNGLTMFFEDGKYGVSDWGKRRGIWMVTGSNRVSGIGYAGRHTVVEFDRNLGFGTLILDGKRYSKITRRPRVIEPNAKPTAGPVFESVLGTYGQAIRGKRQPFVNLRPPNRNLWTKDIEAKLRKTLSYGSVDYIGTAKLIIPQSGTYRIDIPASGTQLRLNGHLIHAGDLELRKGVYDVNLYTNHWGQPYLKFAHAAVFKKATSSRIPFVNTADAIEKVLSKKNNGHTVIEVSNFQPKRIEATKAKKR